MPRQFILFKPCRMNPNPKLLKFQLQTDRWKIVEGDKDNTPTMNFEMSLNSNITAKYWSKMKSRF